MINPLDNDIKYLKGVGSERAKRLNKLGVFTIKDLVYLFPRAYEDRTVIKKISQIGPSETCSIVATVVTPVRVHKISKAMTLYKFTVADETGRLNITLFNQKYAAEQIKENKVYLFYGKLDDNFRSMTSPDFEEVDPQGDIKGAIVPIYALTAGLTQKVMYKLTGNALSLIYNQDETLDDNLRLKHHLAYRTYALYNIHRPKSFNALETARRRLVFEELLLLQLGLFKLRSRNRGQTGIKFSADIDLENFYSKLPFTLTNAQKRAIDEALADLSGDEPMCRLIQGDVGSGKTIVAAALIFTAFKNSCQCALMVPTEILAVQHYNSLNKLLSEFGIKCELLVGSLNDKAKKAIYEKIKNAEADLIIGTHALIQEQVEFSRLGLVITDEQHRFGVKQRALLTDKGENPHVLVMSATPIPRSLALMLYGDLDISVIDEMPPGRQKVDTLLVNSSYRDRLYSFVHKNITAGRQAYVVCPLAEENEEISLKDTESYAAELKEKYFGDCNTAFIHGKLKAKVKEEIMRDFAAGKISLLVSTTVIEVGVDVPNATIMVIENAERFGLSQLHQLRGRVGRGSEKSYCILISDNESVKTRERLNIMCKTNDGFEISRKDLELRGPGDFFGERQSGILKLKIADLITDMKTLKEAQDEAQSIIKTDPDLSKDEHRSLRAAVKDILNRNGLSIYQ